MDQNLLNHPRGPWNQELKNALAEVAKTIRQLSLDAVQKANSGHPGLPLGCAEIGAFLYGYWLKQNPSDYKWLNRDRFILSAGHGSMLLYSCLHLSGYPLSIDEIKRFRQLHSKTPGHPESLDLPEIETTTGPLGQGVGNAVGQALGLKILETKFNSPEYPIFNGKVYCLAGDGCMMEGVSSEVSSLGGHLGMNNIVLIYDYNKVTLDGPLSQSSSEDTAARYRAYHWDVYEIDGHDLDAIHATFQEIEKKQDKPVLVIARTIIGKGSPHLAGTHKVHGSPMSADEYKLTREALGLSDEPFYVPQSVYDFFAKKLAEDKKHQAAWTKMVEEWKSKNKEQGELFDKMVARKVPADLEEQLRELALKAPEATRNSSNAVLQFLADKLPYLYGGSADLSESDKTMLNKFPLIGPKDFSGRNIKYGVREFGMATMATGLFQTHLIQPFIGTFLTFSDYMRNAIRLAALQKAHVIYQFTHDSIFLGEDGPTHQPVEQYASLRAIPHLHFIRPADNNEVKMGWLAALTYEGPTAFALSRQNLPELKETNVPFKDGMGRGAYIVRKEKGQPDFTLFATGSEVSLALKAADILEAKGKHVRVVSMPCWEIFEKQPKEYIESVAGGDIGRRVSIEAGVSFGWDKWIGRDGISIAVNTFGLSAPLADLQKEFGFTPDQVVAKICP